MKVVDLIDELRRKKQDICNIIATLTNMEHSHVMDIAKFYRDLYDLIYKYYNEQGGFENFLKDLGKYSELAKKEIEEKLKKLENKYIELECVVIEDGKEVKKKIQINAKLLIEALIAKFGESLWRYLAIRTIPPEIIMFIIGCLEDLYARCSRYETLAIRITEFLTIFSTTLEQFFARIEEFNKRIEEIQAKIEELDKRLTALLEKI